MGVSVAVVCRRGENESVVDDAGRRDVAGVGDDVIGDGQRLLLLLFQRHLRHIRIPLRQQEPTGILLPAHGSLV